MVPSMRFLLTITHLISTITSFDLAHQMRHGPSTFPNKYTTIPYSSSWAPHLTNIVNNQNIGFDRPHTPTTPLP